ncbi:V-type ATP synthase subunit I domain-containing protein [Metamycoplasma gateae]|uniref:Uncharacterized protein n=1 Tax=Metamycoplasma gateae TaxID=35769 RepID=A0ABZ2AID0_9BACT|nr:hypothetical protein V2E26_01550 [Metamycoplasma gateae]
MKRSKKLLMWLGISNAIATTALTITVATLFSKKSNNTSYEAKDLNILNKQKYLDKLNELNSLLENELNDEKYQSIKDELQNSRNNVTANINESSNEADYANAIKLLQKAIDKALADKAEMDDSIANLNASKEAYENKLLEIDQYSNTNLSNEELEKIKELKDLLTLETNNVKTNVENEETKSVSLFSNAVNKLDEILADIKSKLEKINNKLNKINSTKAQKEEFLSLLESLNKDYYADLIQEVKDNLDTKYSTDKVNQYLEMDDLSWDLTEQPKLREDLNNFKNKKQELDNLEAKKEEYNSKALEVQNYLDNDLAYEKYESIKEELNKVLNDIKTEVSSHNSSNISESINFYNEKIQKLSEALEKAKNDKEQKDQEEISDTEITPEAEYNNSLAEINKLIARFDKTQDVVNYGKIRQNYKKIVKEMQKVKQEQEQKVQQKTEENADQVYSEANEKIKEIISLSLSKWRQLYIDTIKSVIKNYVQPGVEAFFEEIETNDVYKNKYLSETAKKRYEYAKKIIDNPEEFIDSKLSINLDEKQLKSFFDAFFYSFSQVELEIEDKSWIFSFDKESVEKHDELIKRADKLSNDLNEEKYQNIKIKLDQKISSYKAKYEKNQKEYIQFENIDIYRLDYLQTLQNQINSAFENDINEAETEKQEIDSQN